MAEHRTLTGANLHEPKGCATANADEVYVADGAGSGSWGPVLPEGTDAADQYEAFLADGAGSGAYAFPYLLQDGWRDEKTSLLTSNAGSLNAPDLVKMLDNGSGSTGIYQYAFDASTEEEVFMAFHIDHDYKLGTALYPHIHWSPSTTNTGTVRWGIEYSWANRDDTTPVAFPATTIIYLEQAATGTAYDHIVTEVADPGITFTDIDTDALILMRVFRDATHANDTYTGDAFGLFVDIHYQVDRHSTPNRAPDFRA